MVPPNYVKIFVVGVVVAHIYPTVTGQRKTLIYWAIHTLFYYIDYFVIGGIRTCLGVSDDPMFLWISSNSCPLNLLLVRSHQAEIIIVKRLIQGRNYVTGCGLNPDHSISVDVKTTSLPIRPRCRLNIY